ncbi:hypothetical protein FM106_23000 [Brachybacterium faecium]|nr:hypothetical protein FM106_23000 [Brachybacterium faecium]
MCFRTTITRIKNKKTHQQVCLRLYITTKWTTTSHFFMTDYLLCTPYFYAKYDAEN